MAVHRLNMEVGQDRIVGLIGPNGAGKSTVLNIIDGALRPSRGEVVFNGEEITKLPTHQRARRGIARVFQENLLFSRFSVLENVQVGFHLQTRMNLGRIFLRSGSYRRQEKVLQEKALETLEFVGLAPFADESAVNLPHGRQRLLSLAVALATGPRLLLLDEPLTGMNAQEVETMLNMVRALRKKKGITCIIIEHNLKAIMGLCDRIAVLNFGSKIAEGPPEEIVKDPAVMEAYLGTEDNVA
ncbi:MAG: ABC transporter ATP-binding protein [Thermodesulfobacteriota bacterium]